MPSDRHGRTPRADGDRGRRPPQGFRAADTRRFEHLARDALAKLPSGVADAVAGAELTVAAVPPSTATGPGSPELARFSTARPGHRARLELFRGPIELRASDQADLLDIIAAATIDAVSDALGHPPGLRPDEGP